MYKFFTVVLIFTLVAGCSSVSDLPPASTLPSASASAESSMPAASPTQDTTPAEAQTAAATRTPRPPLAPEEWKTLPAVPAGVSDAMREVYQRGLAMGNDPKHFSVIGDCQNVSSYFLYIYDHPEEFSLGEQYAYLQPTIDYYQGSFSRKSLAVKGGFNVAAVQSPLRADPKSCNKNESPL